MRRKLRWLTLTILVGSLISQTHPALADNGGPITLTHTSPAVAWAGQDLNLGLDFTQTCMFDCGSMWFRLLYSAPWGEQIVQEVERSSSLSGSVDFKVPGNIVRAIYPDVNYVPTFSYRFLAGWCSETSSECNYDAPSGVSPSIGSHVVPVVHRIDQQFIDGNGVPVENLEWQLVLFTHPSTASGAPVQPSVVASGVTDLNGFVRTNLPVTSEVLNAAGRNGGYANFSLWAFCNVTQQPGNRCPTNQLESNAAEAWYAVTAIYANYGDPAEDASISGSSLVTEKAVETSRAEGAGIEPTSGCTKGWYLEGNQEYLTTIGEVHVDYGLRGTITYGNKADTSIGAAVQVQQGAWMQAEGWYKIGTTTEDELSHTIDGTSGTSATRLFSRIWAYYQKWRYQETRSAGSTTYCYVFRYIIPGHWVPERGLFTGTQVHDWGDCPHDRAYGACASYGNRVYQSDTGVNRELYRTSKEKATTYGGGIRGYAAKPFTVEVKGFSGHSTNIELVWESIARCRDGWSWYFDGVMAPKNAPEKYADAGIPDDYVSGDMAAGC